MPPRPKQQRQNYTHAKSAPNLPQHNHHHLSATQQMQLSIVLEASKESETNNNANANANVMVTEEAAKNKQTARSINMHVLAASDDIQFANTKPMTIINNEESGDGVGDNLVHDNNEQNSQNDDKERKQHIAASTSNPNNNTHNNNHQNTLSNFNKNSRPQTRVSGGNFTTGAMSGKPQWQQKKLQQAAAGGGAQASNVNAVPTGVPANIQRKKHPSMRGGRGGHGRGGHHASIKPIVYQQAEVQQPPSRRIGGGNRHKPLQQKRGRPVGGAPLERHHSENLLPTKGRARNSDDDGGYYDDQGFYIYPDGSFLDPDGYNFDPYGYDELGGHYDDANVYHPPPDPDDNTLYQQQKNYSCNYTNTSHYNTQGVNQRLKSEAAARNHNNHHTSQQRYHQGSDRRHYHPTRNQMDDYYQEEQYDHDKNYDQEHAEQEDLDLQQTAPANNHQNSWNMINKRRSLPEYDHHQQKYVARAARGRDHNNHFYTEPDLDQQQYYDEEAEVEVEEAEVLADPKHQDADQNEVIGRHAPPRRGRNRQPNLNQIQYQGHHQYYSQQKPQHQEPQYYATTQPRRSGGCTSGRNTARPHNHPSAKNSLNQYHRGAERNTKGRKYATTYEEYSSQQQIEEDQDQLQQQNRQGVEGESDQMHRQIRDQPLSEQQQFQSSPNSGPQSSQNPVKRTVLGNADLPNYQQIRSNTNDIGQEEEQESNGDTKHPKRLPRPSSDERPDDGKGGAGYDGEVKEGAGTTSDGASWQRQSSQQQVMHHDVPPLFMEQVEQLEFKIYEKGVISSARSGGGASRGGRGGQGGPSHVQYGGRGAFRGGWGRPTPKPAFEHYSDLTVSSQQKHDYSSGGYQQHQLQQRDESAIMPFEITSPDILRVKGTGAGEGHHQAQQHQQTLNLHTSLPPTNAAPSNSDGLFQARLLESDPSQVQDDLSRIFLTPRLSSEQQVTKNPAIYQQQLDLFSKFSHNHQLGQSPVGGMSSGMVMASPFGLLPQASPTLNVGAGQSVAEMQHEVQNSISNINKNLERHVPSHIDPVVHYQYTQIMMQNQQQQEQLMLQDQLNQHHQQQQQQQSQQSIRYAQEGSGTTSTYHGQDDHIGSSQALFTASTAEQPAHNFYTTASDSEQAPMHHPHLQYHHQLHQHSHHQMNNKLSHSNSEERTEEFIRMKQSEIAAMISDDQEDEFNDGYNSRSQNQQSVMAADFVQTAAQEEDSQSLFVLNSPREQNQNNHHYQYQHHQLASPASPYCQPSLVMEARTSPSTNPFAASAKMNTNAAPFQPPTSSPLQPLMQTHLSYSAHEQQYHQTQENNNQTY